MKHMPSLFEFLDSEAGAPLRAHFREQAFAKGALLREEERDQIFVVKRGRLRVYLATEHRELSLAYLTDGDVFSTHTRAQLQAVQATSLLLARRETVERLLFSFPILQIAVIRVLAMTLSQSMNLIEDLAFHQVRGRIARYLIRCGERQKVTIEQGMLIRLDLGMEEIAALLGTTRQTASTELNAMFRTGVISRHDRKHIAVMQPDRLLGWAEPQDVS